MSAGDPKKPAAPARPAPEPSAPDFDNEDTHTFAVMAGDAAGADEVTAEHDVAGLQRAVDAGSRREDWANWDPDDADEGWYRYLLIEAAGQGADPRAARRRLNEFGVRDEQQWAAVRATFLKRHGQDQKARARALERQKRSMGA